MTIVKKQTIDWRTWIGWAATVLLSIFTAWAAMNARMYTVEKEIDLLKARITISEKILDKQSVVLEQLELQGNEIKQSLIRIEGVLNTKQDKRWE
ncbi:MAG TPA: hypothetical protein PLK02_07415 [Paludibacteraceae bacterium]|nr:hypothetical protein [Paludibacteraceae bacterium]